MASRAGLLRYLGDLVHVLESRDKWFLCKILKDSFWDRELVTAASPFEHGVSDDEDGEATPLSHFMHQTMLDLPRE